MQAILLALAITVVGFGIAVFASQQAVAHAVKLAHALRIPSFVVGITLMSIGTDIPEIANSIMASLAGHGDLNVGDSVGSVATQITLVLGLLPFITGTFVVGKSRILVVSGLTIFSLGLGAFLVADGYLSRGDAMLLFTSWIVATAIVTKYAAPFSEHKEELEVSGKMYHGTMVLGSLVLVGLGAGIGVKGIISLAETAQVPEYFISFFGASIGTSLPELFVDITALRSGRKDIAIGDVFGSCMVDASLSISAGPLLAPTLVTAALAVKGAILAIAVVLITTAVLALRQRHDRWSGALLLLLYGGVYYALIAG